MQVLIAAIVAAHPEFAAEVEGVSAEELAELELCVGPLPEDYAAVLAFMGRDMGRANPVRETTVHAVGSAPRHEVEPLRANLKHLFKLHRSKANLKAGRRGEHTNTGRLQIATAPRAQDLGYYVLDRDLDPPRVLEVDAYGEVLDAPGALLHTFFFARGFPREVKLRLRALGLA